MKKMHDYNRGNLAAYIELLKAGIRDICFPNASAYKKALIDYVDQEAKKEGFCTLLVTFKRSTPKGRRFKSYQRIVYRRGRREAAKELRDRLQRTPKNKKDHEVIGGLLGYSPRAIASFIKTKPNKSIRRRNH